MYCTLEKVKIAGFMRQQIQLWQHNESFVSNIMFVARLHCSIIVIKFKSKGSVLNYQYRSSVVNIVTVTLSVIEDSKKNDRERAQALTMKPTSLLTILRKYSKLIPYKCHTLQQLSNAGKTAMCQRFGQEIENKNWERLVYGRSTLLFKRNYQLSELQYTGHWGSKRS